MNRSKLRRQITWEAARLMYNRQESEYYRAKLKAARLIGQGWVRPADLPSNAEIRDEIQSLARLYEGDARSDNLQSMRLAALAMMRRFAPFRPRLIGSVLTGHIRQGSDIDIHVFSDTTEAVTHLLDQDGLSYSVERKQVRKQGVEQVFTHVHFVNRFPFEVTIYPADRAHHVSKSSITGKPIERASIAELEMLLEKEYPGLDVTATLADAAAQVDRFQLYESLLLPLEKVIESPKYHPESDALYHSLQVFELARNELAYDEEFLSAALLHDVGKAIDRENHVAAGLEALDGFITERTAWLIANHMLAHQLVESTLGARARRRLQESEHFDDLVLLGVCDRGGRQVGVAAPELDEALECLRGLGEMFG
jgi:hypothetical protein